MFIDEYKKFIRMNMYHIKYNFDPFTTKLLAQDMAPIQTVFLHKTKFTLKLCYTFKYLALHIHIHNLQT